MGRPIMLHSSASRTSWQGLAEAAVLETNRDKLQHLINDAQNAIMDEIEDSDHEETQCEHRRRIQAMHALNELRRVFKMEGFRLVSPSSLS